MKMEGIELYPHNQKAYDNLCAMLRDSNRACVVQPTGTGKFVIIAKMAQDNPGKNFLLLGTNDYMYIDQMANLSDIAPGFTPKNLQFMTYATAMAKARCGDEIPRCDVIVADEFHHCGAPEWGKRDNRGCNQPTAKKVRCAETGNQFVSLSDAARAVGLRNGNSIRRAIDRGGTAGGYHWEYLDEKKEVSTDDHHQADGRAE